MSLTSKLFVLMSPLLLTQCVDPMTGSDGQRRATNGAQPRSDLIPTPLALSYVSLATATDQGPQDGVFDAFVPDNLGSVNNNGYTSMRTAFEFSLAAIPPDATIDAAVLTVALSNFEGTRSLQVHGYSGDGTVTLADFARTGLVASFTAGIGTQSFQFDVTSFIRNLTSTGGSYAGFNVREQPANGSNFTVMNLALAGSPPNLNVTYSPPRAVRIDIKPGDGVASINIHSHGKIPVAVLGDAGLDVATDLDPASLTFGRTGNETSLAFCDKTPADVNGDGFPDLLCHFETETSAFLAHDTQAVLKGMTRTGTRIRGSDAIRIVP
jgi:hypothetical protein